MCVENAIKTVRKQTSETLAQSWRHSPPKVLALVVNELLLRRVWLEVHSNQNGFDFDRAD